MLYDMKNKHKTVCCEKHSLSETLYVMENRKNDVGILAYALLIVYLTMFWTTKSKYQTISQVTYIT